MDNERLQKLESIYVQMNFAYNQRNENDMRMLFKKLGL